MAFRFFFSFVFLGFVRRLGAGWAGLRYSLAAVNHSGVLLLKALLQITFCFVLLDGCVSNPKSQSDPVPTVRLGDPLFAKDAPRLVSYRDIELSYQPPTPPYPQQALGEGIQGEVLVEVWVDAKGTPTRSTALLGPKELRLVAADYILGWRFKPYPFEGSPIPTRFRVSMPFRLFRGDVGPFRRLPKGLEY
ncbi:MAG: TonB family protein [Geothrix sp.]|nr:TonB family protein [Geothrix sp.]